MIKGNPVGIQVSLCKAGDMDSKAIKSLLQELCMLYGPSGQEAEVADFCTHSIFEAFGFQYSFAAAYLGWR